MSESPTLEEPKVEEPKVETTTDEAQSIAAKLNELGIDDIGKVQSTVQAAQQAGNLANLLGEERAARAQLEQQLRDIQSQRVDVPTDDYGIDLEKVTERAMEKFWNRKQSEAQMMQKRQMQEFQKIRTNKNYALVGKDFEEYTKTPDYQNEIMNGKSPSEIFHDMTSDRLREYLVKMKDAIEQRTVSPKDVPVPHTENGQSPPAMEPEDNDKDAKIKQAKKNWKGNDDDIENVLDAILPSGTLPM